LIFAAPGPCGRTGAHCADPENALDAVFAREHIAGGDGDLNVVAVCHRRRSTAPSTDS
jgi:hypothetical protein